MATWRDVAPPLAATGRRTWAGDAGLSNPLNRCGSVEAGSDKLVAGVAGREALGVLVPSMEKQSAGTR